MTTSIAELARRNTCSQTGFGISDAINCKRWRR